MMALNNLFTAKDNFVPRPFGYFEYLALQGIPHGLKPSSSHLSVPAPYGVSKSAVRNVMSPVHQSGPHAAAGFSPFTNSINPALNATRTSSFAAALRKLAKQAVDPIAEKELSPISPASTPSSSQQSIHNRQHPPMPMYMNSHNPNPPGHGSPSPSVTPSQSSHGKALDLGRYSNTHRNGSIVEPVSLKIENSKLISSSNDKRNDIPTGNKHLGPPNLPPSLRQDHSLSRGFQPYRNSEERRPTPPQGYNPSPPPNSMSGYAYHPSILQSSRIPPQSYSRLEESMYMERYGLLRPSSMPYPPPTNMIPHPRAPIYPPNQYPPELISQSMRPISSNSSSYSTSRYNTEEEDSKDSSMLRRREIIYQHERYSEREEGESRDREIEYMRKERNLMRQSPLNSHHSSSRLESSNEEKGHMGSITHGTPREYGRSMSPPTSTSTTPLNLATTIAHMENHLPPKDEYSSRMSRPGSNTINGQMHLRSTNHIRDMNYRKENDPTSSYRMHYQMNMENEKKPPIHMENPEPSIPVSTHSKSHSYFIERDSLKPNIVETRTLSLGSVIDSQINGIFARDNIVCNNNSYFSLNTESNQWENPIKLESENKKPFSAQEPYSIPSKVPSSEKSHESLTSDSSSGKMPPYMLSEHPYLYQGDSNGYPPTYRAKEPFLTRVLKNQDVTYESEMHSFNEPVERTVSVLDSREARLRKLRKDGVIEESDESGIESDEEDSDKLKELLTIRKGPPLKIESDPKKSKFLFYFGLVTDSKRQTLELKKQIRRHKALRERSLSPVEESSVKKEKLIEYDSAHLAELSSRLCYSEDFQAKTEFLRALDLKNLPPEEKEEREEIIKIVEEERLRRNGLLPPSERCIELQGSHIRKRGCNILDDVKHDAAKKPNVNQDESLLRFAVPERVVVHKNEPSLKDAKCAIASVQRLSSFLKPPMRTVPLPVPPLIPTCQVVPHASEAAQNKNPSIVVAKDPRVRQVNKDFVQEFHNSVLQTTQMQLAEKKNIPPIVPLEPSFQKSPVSAVAEKSDWFYLEYKPPFRWPGIEAIMESYECHISEQNVERKFLTESCQKLKALNEKSNIEVECLRKKTEELLKEKQLLECKRQELQSSYEKLKLIIQHFR
ncbi:unnamed protein product [Larinioides sclopetarius]|uniref:Genetic suppressor element-like domain-containing protein n=1 Tax=Larinioides sclopetarius TaxID=280406 RepID=A0AAV1ZLE7_9ARAC